MLQKIGMTKIVVDLSHHTAMVVATTEEIMQTYTVTNFDSREEAQEAADTFERDEGDRYPVFATPRHNGTAWVVAVKQYPTYREFFL